MTKPRLQSENSVQFSRYMKKVLTSKFVGAIISLLLESKCSLTYKRWVKAHPYELVLIAMRVHLFPSRTQKLSSFAPTIVAGRLAVKIGNANTKIPL